MGDLLSSLNGVERLPADISLQSLLLTLLLAFLLGQVLSWTYVWTHSGLSYSRSFAQSLVIMAVVVATLLTVIGNSLVTAFGLLGALALVRFRNVLKDTRDTVFVFVAIVIGISVGTQRYVTGVAGTLVILAFVWYLEAVSFGTLSRFDGYLTLRLATRREAGEAADAVLRRYCRSSRQISRRQAGDDQDAELVFQLGLRDRNRADELLTELYRVDGISHASILLRDELSEA